MTIRAKLTTELWEIVREFSQRWRPRQPRPTDAQRMEDLLAEYPNDRFSTRVKLREWHDRDSAVFWAAAFHAMNHPDGEERFGALRELITGTHVLVELLLDSRELPEEDVKHLAQAIASQHKNLDIELSSRMREISDPAADSRYVPRVLRVMEIIDAISEPARVASLVIGFGGVRDPRVASKLALVLGRSHNPAAWTREKMLSADARLRANAVEGLWYSERSADVLQVLWDAVRDSNHRVVANALVGLCKMGELQAFELLDQLTRHPQEEFRAAAAWAMGELADERFDQRLREMLQNESGNVKHNAHKALVRARKTRQKQAAAARLEVHEGGVLLED